MTLIKARAYAEVADYSVSAFEGPDRSLRSSLGYWREKILRLPGTFAKNLVLVRDDRAATNGFTRIYRADLKASLSRERRSKEQEPGFEVFLKFLYANEHA